MILPKLDRERAMRIAADTFCRGYTCAQATRNQNLPTIWNLLTEQAFNPNRPQ
jgi:hypothetical protein